MRSENTLVSNFSIKISNMIKQSGESMAHQESYFVFIYLSIHGVRYSFSRLRHIQVSGTSKYIAYCAHSFNLYRTPYNIPLFFCSVQNCTVPLFVRLYNMYVYRKYGSVSSALIIIILYYVILSILYTHTHFHLHKLDGMYQVIHYVCSNKSENEYTYLKRLFIIIISYIICPGLLIHVFFLLKQIIPK